MDHVEGASGDELKGILADPGCHRGKAMQTAKDLIGDLKAKTGQKVSEERDKAKEKINRCKTQLSQMSAFHALPPEIQSGHLGECDAATKQLFGQQLIAVIRDKARTFEETEFPRILQQVSQHGKEEGGKGDGRDAKKVTYIYSGAVQVPFDKMILESDDDVERYVEALKKAYLSNINSNIHIQIKSN